MGWFADGLHGRWASPVAVACVCGSLWGSSAEFCLPLGAVVAALWLVIALVLGRRGMTLGGAAAGWLSVLLVMACCAHWQVTRPPSAASAPTSLAVHLVRPDGHCRRTPMGRSFTGEWLTRCSVGQGRMCSDPGGPVRVLLPSGAAVPASGVPVRVVGVATPAIGYRNPGFSARPRPLAALIASRTAPLHNAPSATVTAEDAALATDRSAACSLRLDLADAVSRATKGRDQGLFAALALGDRADLPRRIVASMRRMGTAHLLAVSGTHVGIVFGAAAGLLLFMLRRLPAGWLRRCRGRWFAAGGAVAVGWCYAALAGMPVSAQRAMCMATVGAICWADSERPEVLEVLGLAVATLVVCDPLAAADLGLQLSVLGVLGAAWGDRAARGAGQVAAEDGGSRAARWRAGSARVMTACVGAWALTSLVSVPAFFVVTWAAPVSNLLIMPWFACVTLPAALVGSAITAGALGLGVDPAQLSGVGGPLAALAVAPVQWAARVPLQTWPISVAGGWAASVCGALIAATWLAWILGARRLAAAALGLALLVPVAHRRLNWPPAGVFDAWLLDVGHGDAIALRFADGQTMLVDGGGGAHDDGAVGAAAVVPALRALGIDRIDTMVMTHPDADHENGLLAVARAMPVAELWWTGASSSSAEHRHLIAELARMDTRWRKLPRRATAATAPAALAWHGVGVSVRQLWPVHTPGPGHRDRNDDSIVLVVGTRHVDLVLTGDIEARGEAYLSRRPWRRRTRVLKVPHHGSRTSSSAPFLDTLAPAVAVVSARPWGRHPLPHPTVAARYRERGITLWSTAAGAIAMRFFPGSAAFGQAGRRLVLASPAGEEQPDDRQQADAAERPTRHQPRRAVRPAHLVAAFRHRDRAERTIRHRLLHCGAVHVGRPAGQRGVAQHKHRLFGRQHGRCYARGPPLDALDRQLRGFGVRERMVEQRRASVEGRKRVQRRASVGLHGDLVCARQPRPGTWVAADHELVDLGRDRPAGELARGRQIASMVQQVARRRAIEPGRGPPNLQVDRVSVARSAGEAVGVAVGPLRNRRLVAARARDAKGAGPVGVPQSAGRPEPLPVTDGGGHCARCCGRPIQPRSSHERLVANVVARERGRFTRRNDDQDDAEPAVVCARGRERRHRGRNDTGADQRGADALRDLDQLRGRDAVGPRQQGVPPAGVGVHAVRRRP